MLKRESIRRRTLWLCAASASLTAPAVAGSVIGRSVEGVVPAVSGVSTAVEVRTIQDLSAPLTVLPNAGISADAAGLDETAAIASEPSPKLAAKRALAPERVAAPTRAIEALARGASSFDGPSSESAVWSEEPGSVRTLGVSDGHLLINGKKPRQLMQTTTRAGVSERILLHPDDESLVVTLYHGPDSMDGFERQTGKVERLAPLSAAESAPEIVEHGEASLPGLGRVYFYVQKLVHGAKLSELPSEAWPTGAVEGLFGRLERAGLKLETWGPDASRLASQILAGEDGAGGVRAYLLDGQTEPATAEALRKHYAMLEALLPEVGEEARDGRDPRLKDAISKARSAAETAPLAERVIPAREKPAIRPPAASRVQAAAVRIPVKKDWRRAISRFFSYQMILKIAWITIVSVVIAVQMALVGGGSPLMIGLCMCAATTIAWIFAAAR